MSRAYRIIWINLCVACFTLGLCWAEETYSQDSYLNAPQTYNDNGSGGYNYSPPVNNNYLPPATPSYVPPQPVYGPPPPHHPAPVYGPPQPFYNPAITVQPRDHWFLEKLKTKINLFAIGKIILKLLIFKKIVKFIGLICLLLFLPKLKDMFKDDMMNMDEDGTESKTVETETDLLEKRIDELYEFLQKSLKNYTE